MNSNNAGELEILQLNENLAETEFQAGLPPNLRHINNLIFYVNSGQFFSLKRQSIGSAGKLLGKRIFDLVFSSMVILVVFPWLFPIIAIAIKFSSKGPVIFKQLRSGKDNKPFVCYKFRTMRVNPMSDQLQATENDPRITSVGKYLRITSLDELPQFINVLLGDMSVVGPRPHMLSHTEKYAREIGNFMMRHYEKPGITGLAQVKGCRGETRDTSQMARRVRWDLWYIEKRSFIFDLKIIILTITAMLKGDINGA